MDVGIVPVDDSELLGSPLFAGAVRRMLSDKSEKLKLANDRLIQIDRHIALSCMAMSLCP